MTILKCISPIDGSVYAERPTQSFDEASAAIAKARAARKDWARQPLDKRIKLVMAGVARLNEMVDEAVPELAHMIGRPVKYGGEFRGFNERSNYVASIAGEALSPLVVEDSATFTRQILREPHGVVLVIAPWNYPYMTAINTVAPGSDGRQHRRHQACDAKPAGGRTHGAPLSRPACRRMSSRTCSSTTRRPRS